jgi:hypothetical protein
MIPALGSLHTGRLVLAPLDPLQAADQATTYALLREIGLAGPGRGDGAGFAAGPALGALIGFTGCAVQFAHAAAAASGPWLRLPPPNAAPRLLWGRNSRPPRCPDCAAALRPWRERLTASPEGLGPGNQPGLCCDARTELHCDACGSANPTYRWRWGQHAGAGRSFVLIEEVFPGEARPLPALMQALAGLGAGPWTFFYVQD